MADINKKKRRTKPDKQKLQDQVKIVADEAEHDLLGILSHNDIGPSSDEVEYGPHTLLKLAYLNYYLGFFAPIARRWKNQHRFDRILFIDAFGGSGLVNIRNTKYTVLGSTLLASSNPVFDLVISVEINPERANLLEKRVKLVSNSKTLVVCGDINKEIKRIVDDHVTDRTLVLFFVDPEGMEPDFTQLKCLMERTDFVDLIMNFTWGIYRLEGRIQAHFNKSDEARMEKFLPTYEPGKDISNATLELFEGIFGKPFGDEVEIRSHPNKPPEYSMILRLRKTQSGTAWLKDVEAFGRIVSKFSGETALEILNQLKYRQQSLDDKF